MAGLTLACTGKPVLHAYAGPMGLLSFAFGATGVAIGHSQNLWKFTRDRWALAGAQGGGGDAPARFFSQSLWGTIVYPDETIQLPQEIRDQVITVSPFAQPVRNGLPWSRWDSGKHLVYMLSRQYLRMAAQQDPRENARAAISLLENAVTLHSAIQRSNVFLADNTQAYQGNWKAALEDLLRDNKEDFEYLDLLS